MQVVGSIRAFYSAIPVDVVVLCEFPLSLCVCYSEDHNQLPIAKYLLYMTTSFLNGFKISDIDQLYRFRFRFMYVCVRNWTLAVSLSDIKTIIKH